MKGLMLAIFLGWAGGYRFYKKQKVLGFIYLFTLGLYGIGWIVDIIIAARQLYRETAMCRGFSNVFVCEIRGSFAKCKKNPDLKRASVVETVSVGDPLVLEMAYYKGTPYYLVCTVDGLDVGALPKELSQVFMTKYPKAAFKCVLTDKRDLTYPRMRIEVEANRRK